MYIVKYYAYDNEIDIFVTHKKSVATKYVNKFNKIFKKWKDYYKQYEVNNGVINCISDEYKEKYYERWISLRDIGNCYWEEIDYR